MLGPVWDLSIGGGANATASLSTQGGGAIAATCRGCGTADSGSLFAGISTRQVGRVIGVITGEVVSAQTVSTISRSLDGMVKEFHQARLSDDWVYLFL